jgi:hypothetical protein
MKGSGKKRENSGGDESNLGTTYVNMEISQQNLLYSYHIMIKNVLIN